jgi:pimeloyl-ACP methyl ester carboxylesterase/DNA-binding CsgD family transcriptional regulator
MNAPNNSSELLSEMIGLIYEAATDLSLWPKLLESMSGYLELSLSDAAETAYPLNPIDQTLIQFLAPHFLRAQVIHQQLADMVEERDLFESFLNRLPLGAAIIDPMCAAISMNRALVTLLQSNSSLRLLEGRLVSSPSNALQQAVGRVLARDGGDEVIRLGGEEGEISLWISGRGLPNRADKVQTRLMVFVASRTSHALSEQGLITFFGLTPAEARITQQFALGHSLEESADILGLSPHTVRTHLKHVFGKVGVKRQSELMQAIYASPLWLKSDKKEVGAAPLAITGVMLVRSESEELHLKLMDGRRLYFSDSGDPLGHPVVLMHGIAGSRYLRHPDDAILMQEGIRLIIPERPGSGDSDVQVDRCVADWPQDMLALADHLKLKRFSVLGYSAGTAYALAVAAAMPERIHAVNIVAAVPPISNMEDMRAYSPVFRMTLFIARYTPGLLSALMRVMVKDIRNNVYQYLEKIFSDAPEQDRQILANPRLRANIAAGLRASVQRSEQEIALEVLLTAKDWELDMSRIPMRVRIWYGEKDPLVSPDAAKKLATLLPDADVIMVPEAGHYLLYSHWQEILHSVKTLE